VKSSELTDSKEFYFSLVLGLHLPSTNNSGILKLCKLHFVLQSKSLIGDQSIVFSPPSIIKETLCDEKSFSFNDAFTFPKSPNISAVKVSLFNTFLDR